MTERVVPSTSRATSVCMGEFLRTRDGKYEPCVVLLEEPGTHTALAIVSLQGEMVGDVWYYRLHPHQGAMTIPQRGE